MQNKYLVLAFYRFVAIEDPHAEVIRQKTFLEKLDVRARIYISEEGVNAQMSALEEDAHTYMEWLKADDRFKDTEFKFDPYNEHVFPRLTVKYRQQLVAMDVKLDIKDGGTYLSPSEWKQKLEERDEETLLLDVRNDYEWKIGHFEGAVLPPLEKFRDFPLFARRLKEKFNPERTKVMMYCTGGIRCELYSALVKQEGFSEVYQLHGGVINYGHEEGTKHWKGKLFVFDDRLAVPLHPEEASETIGQCCHCHAPSDTYYNCANMDCNELFLLCPECANEMEGSCSEACKHAERRRPFDSSQKPKPYRRKHCYNGSVTENL